MEEIDIITNNLLEAYKELSLDSKRNEFNKEMIILTSLINSLLSNYTNKKLHMTKNYKKGIDTELTEDEVLTNNYIDLLELKNNILTLITCISNK